MKPILLIRSRLAVLLCAWSVATFVGMAVTSDPVGDLRLKLTGGSDTYVSLPLHRAPLVETTLAAHSGGQLTLTASVSGIPSEGAYALMMSGSLEGAVLPVDSASGTSVTVESVGFDLSSLANGDVCEIIPYWTLDTVFPSGASMQATTGLGAVASEVVMFDDSGTGTNFSASASYFYFAGNQTYGAGWYKYGDLSGTCGTTRIPPNHYFIVRHQTGAPDTELLVTGGVQMARARIVLATKTANQAQDNLVSLPIPLGVTLGSSGLTDSGAFTPTTSFGAVQDELIVFDNTVAQINKSAAATYFYFAGNSSYTAGWYKYGDLSQTVPSVSLSPGQGFIIRKAATSSAQASVWSLLPSYLQ